MRKFISFFTVACLLTFNLLITGCGNDTTTSAPLVSIAVTPTTPSVAAGTTQQFTATGTYSDNSTKDITTLVTWTSSDTTKATIVSNTGVASTIATAAGTTTITATAGTITGNTVLTVTHTLTSIAVTPLTSTIRFGLTKQFVATGTYSDSTTADITALVAWTSSDTSKATIVSNTGLATGVAAGSTTITATSGNVSGDTTLTVSDAYTYTGNVYSSTNNYTSCTEGNCTNYTTAMKITGSFATSVPLAANLVSSNITSLLTSYSFNDGINTYASTDPKSRTYFFSISTDSSGNITSSNILLEQWATVTTPHASGNRFSYINIATNNQVFNNAVCGSVSTSPTNTSDACNASNGGSSQSSANVNSVGTWN